MSGERGAPDGQATARRQTAAALEIDRPPDV
jgi:hypothetical protein